MVNRHAKATGVMFHLAQKIMTIFLLFFLFFGAGHDWKLEPSQQNRVSLLHKILWNEQLIHEYFEIKSTRYRGLISTISVIYIYLLDRKISNVQSLVFQDYYFLSLFEPTKMLFSNCTRALRLLMFMTFLLAAMASNFS